jgi:hypothetical protein
MSLLIGNVTQPRFHLTGNGLIFDKTLILKVFGLLQEKENGYEEGRTRGAKNSEPCRITSTGLFFSGLPYVIVLFLLGRLTSQGLGEINR